MYYFEMESSLILWQIEIHFGMHNEGSKSKSLIILFKSPANQKFSRSLENLVASIEIVVTPH